MHGGVLIFNGHINPRKMRHTWRILRGLIGLNVLIEALVYGFTFGTGFLKQQATALRGTAVSRESGELTRNTVTQLPTVGAGLRDPDLKKIHVFVSDPARTHLRPAEAPSAQIGRRQDLEMRTPEVLAKSASQNVVALLKNKMGHQVDAGGER